MSKFDITVPSQQNQDSGRWGFQKGSDGDVSFDESGAHAVVASVYSRKGGYWADAELGIRERPEGSRSVTDQSATLEQANTLEALQPIVQDGTIRDLSVSVTRGGVGQLDKDVRWSGGNLTVAGGQASAGGGGGGGFGGIVGGGGGFGGLH